MSSTPVLPDGWRLVALDSVGSTNDEAARLADAGAPEGTVVWAREQTGGRGRRGRAWASPVGNLYTSTILRPDCPAARAAELGFVSALAVADIVPPGRAVRVKWPNDVLVDGGKIAGILLESAIAQTGAVQHVIAGIGINVGFAPQLPEMRYPGAALGGSVETALEMFTAALAAAPGRMAARGLRGGARPLAGQGRPAGRRGGREAGRRAGARPFRRRRPRGRPAAGDVVRSAPDRVG